MGDEKQPYRPLSQMLREVSSAKRAIATEAEAQGHDGFFPVPVVLAGENGKKTIRGQVKAAPSGEKGRLLIFLPTHENVTVVRQKVGQTYAGHWIHEVVSREGKKFLASAKQLKGTE